MTNKRIVQSAIGCTCGNCLRSIPAGSWIWYEGGLANVDGCPKCDEDCKKKQSEERRATGARREC